MWDKCISLQPLLLYYHNTLDNQWVTSTQLKFGLEPCAKHLSLSLFLLKREFCPTLTKYYWVVQFISHGQSSTFKTSFEIELDLLDFNTFSLISLSVGVNG
jgi:hypothetical protein